MGATVFGLAYAELFTGAANIFGGPLTEATGALHTVWFPNWEIIILYGFHCTVIGLLLAMTLIDQDNQRIPLAARCRRASRSSSRAPTSGRTCIQSGRGPFKFATLRRRSIRLRAFFGAPPRCWPPPRCATHADGKTPPV